MQDSEDPQPQDDRSWWDQWAADAERDLMRVLYSTLAVIAVFLAVAIAVTVLRS